MDLNYERATRKHLEEAVNLAAGAYREERQALPILPDAEDFLSVIRESLEEVLEEGSGVFAFSGGRLAGFLVGFPVETLFGKARGIYVPVYGQGTLKENRRGIYRGLYREAAALWVAEERLTHAVTLYAHDGEALDTWFWLGFGLRCVDALREVRPLQAPGLRDIALKKTTLEDLPALAGILDEHYRYFLNSPIFMPHPNKDPLEEFRNWLQKDNHHAWAACGDGKLLGYMRVQPAAESFVSTHKRAMNITGAHVLEGKRKAGIGTMLLEETQRWLATEGYTLCGVDFESFNTPGSSFWNKYFTPYTYSLVRRIDERVLPPGR